jgi:hypothetical protein
LKTLKGQVPIDFIVEHAIDLGYEVNYITCTPYKLYFDGSACKDDQRVDIVIVSPHGAIFEMSCRLD